MARTPVGTDRQPRTDTALFAHIAAKLEGVGVRQLGAWAAELGLLAGAEAIRRAPSTAERLDAISDRRRVVRRWALIDYDALDLFVAVVTLSCSGAREAALRGLERVRGVIDLLALEDGRTVLAIVVYERRQDQRALRTALGEFADVGAWRVVDERRPLAAISTFRTLALKAAGPDELLR
jgi:hypothetical protein